MNAWKSIALASLVGLAVSVAHSAQAGGTCQGQPNMQAALEALRAAKGSLEKAEHNKGGWRVAALNATTTAISETERGCAAAH